MKAVITKQSAVGSFAKPIIFSGAMIVALLEGRKTQTRRVMRPQPAVMGYGQPVWNDENRSIGGRLALAELCPYGQPGDRLWVRETWCPFNNDGVHEIDYRATPKYAEPGVKYPGGWENAPDDPEAARWRPSIHMPRSASRITMEIVGVRVERLPEISEADTIAEGFETGSEYWFSNFREAWSKINAKRAPWDSNPWVWVVEFKVVGL